jgi:HD-GYP domain-containing protein (c-di-GMP phosphodiesterase class II)
MQKSYTRKLAARMSAVSLALAALTGVGAGLLAQQRGEDTLVTQTMEEAQRLLRHDAYRPEGVQATRNAQAAVVALSAMHFDITQIYTPGGLLMAEQMTEAGRAMELARPTNGSNGARSYAQSRYERHTLPGDRLLLRVFVPLRGEGQALTGYLEAARLVPGWQHERLAADARRTGLLVALAVLLGGTALFAVVLHLQAGAQHRQRELLASHIALMGAFGRAIAHSDSDSDSHNYRVAWIAATLGEAVGLRGTPMLELIIGSFLHDVGKIGIPEHIRLHSGPLSEEETRIMRTHVGQGEDIVAGTGWLGGGQAVVAGHHENWDGTGYPRGQRGTDIPLAARICAIADAFDALCSRHPGREPLPLAQALQTLHEGAGTQFDPQLVQVFAELAGTVHRTLIEADEAQWHARLEQLVSRHFNLPVRSGA